MKTRTTLSLLIATSLSFTTLSVQAHTGHGAQSLMEGLAHPLGADHLLAMLSVGVWSVSAMPARQAWQGPAVFMLTLFVSALVGALGITLPFIEQAIALSVVLFGALLVLSSSRIPRPLALGLIAAAASLHGLAHGAEAPATGFAGYAFGFLLTTALLHMGGVAMGQIVRRALAYRSALAITGLGAAIGGSGLLLFSQL